MRILPVRLLMIVLVAAMLSGCGYNEIQSKDEAVTAAWSQVLNVYKRRADLVLLLGGIFLVFKGVMEIRDQVVGEHESEDIHTRPATSFGAVIAQIAVIDIVFSLDSVIAAVGMADQYVPVMVAAILLAVAVMLLAARPLGHFIDNNPTIKMLALAFIVLIGAYLIVEGLEIHVPKGYIYGSMGFSAAVEALNLMARRRARLRAGGNG